MPSPLDVTMLQKLYPAEADLAEGLRRRRRSELIEHAILAHRESKRLFTELEALRAEHARCSA